MANIEEYITAHDPNGVGCAKYYRTFAESNPEVTRAELDTAVRERGYFMTKPSQAVSTDRKWCWKKI